MRDSIVLYVNGQKAKFRDKIDPQMTLIQYLRGMGLTGTKLGCGEGGCGACTVMLSYFDSSENKPRHFSANACLTPLCSLDGYHVLTVEGIGGMREGLHPVQQRISSFHGSQCGFCTPGIVMSLYTILRTHPDATPHEIEEALDGNLCRCTGYRPIIDAAKSLSNNKSGCCGGTGGGCPCKEGDGLITSSSEEVVQSHPSLRESGKLSEPIFPPALVSYTPQPVQIENKGVQWFQPTDMSALLEYRAEHPECKLVVGNTEVGIEVKFKGMEYAHLVNPSRVPELKVLLATPTGLRVGAAVTLESLKEFASSYAEQNSASACRGMVAIRNMLIWFASTQIRNVACLGGNIATASPISDMNPLLCALDATLRLTSKRGTREMPIREFFVSYRKVKMDPDEILQEVFIPFNTEYEFVVPLKQARRREDDISIVTSGMRVRLCPEDDHWKVQDCALAFGGMAPTTIVAYRASAAMIGQPFCRDTLEKATRVLEEELKLPENVPGGQAQYRVALSASFLLRSYIRTCLELKVMLDQKIGSGLPAAPIVEDGDLSAADGFLTLPKPESRGEQSFFRRPGGLQRTTPVPHTPDADAAATRAPVGEPIPHKSADLQVTGEARYTDDIPAPADTLHGALVTSTKAHARITKIDVSACEECPGFVRFFSHSDIPGSNITGAWHDEEVFVSTEVKHYGAIIGLVVAYSHEEAVYAARKVVVEYEELPAIISIEDAIDAQSFFPNPMELCLGDVDGMAAESDIVIEGEVNIGGQEHFYLETNCALVIPAENNSLEIYSSTQNANETQQHCAQACGLPSSHVVCRVKRIGGGFGGKETRTVQFCAPIAVAAHTMGRPVRINIERDLDMSISGQRHAFYAKYRAGCTADGKMKFMDLDLYNNAGYSLDLSGPVMGRALFHCDGPYKWPALRAKGTLCRTNQPSHTAFRGFGGPQGMIVPETIMEHFSTVTGIATQTLREKNLYTLGDHTHFGQPIDEWNVLEAWKQVLDTAHVSTRQAEVDEFNRKNKWRKRGLCVIPTKYGLNYTAKFMNQGGALVNIYSDGSVLVSHGGMEMGQGLHTKMIQVAARALGISHEMVHISETLTCVVPNATPTAGSMGTDMYGMAILNACEQLNERLAPFRNMLDEGKTWNEMINAAYFSRVNLSAQGFYRVPDDRCGYDWSMPAGCTLEDNLKRGHPFNYFTQGAACTEVEVDCLTGDNRIIRTDIVMDVGQSINPAIDIGQIEGAFVQGYGWCTMEELIWGDKQHSWVREGQLFTRGPGTYKIPSFNDVPADFRVCLMDKSNKRAVHSSKGIGEPPYFLACSAFFAIRNAVKAAREQNGVSPGTYLQMNLPATSERIRMACADNISYQTIAQHSSEGGEERFQPKGSW